MAWRARGHGEEQVERGRSERRAMRLVRSGVLLLGADYYGTLAAEAHRRGMAHDVAFERFNLDDVGTEVGKDLGCVRPHHHRGEVQYAYAVERSWHRKRGSVPIFYWG